MAFGVRAGELHDNAMQAPQEVGGLYRGSGLPVQNSHK